MPETDLSSWSGRGELAQAFPNIEKSYSEEFQEHFYSDLTGRSQLTFFESDVDAAITQLEDHANKDFERSPFGIHGYCHKGEGLAERSKCMKAILMSAVPFETEVGDLRVLDSGTETSVVGAFFSHDENEPILHLQYSDAGQTYRANCPFSELIPVLPD